MPSKVRAQPAPKQNASTSLISISVAASAASPASDSAAQATRNAPQRDALTPVLEEILAADALVVAAPIYYGEVPGAVRNFYERLLFPPNHYTGGAPDEGYGRRIRCGLIYTMGVPDQAAHEKTNYDTTARDAARFQRFLGDTETLNAFNAWQFDDYAKYASSGFDPVKKKAYLETEFPKECERAFQLGKRLAE